MRVYLFYTLFSRNKVIKIKKDYHFSMIVFNNINF